MNGLKTTLPKASENSIKALNKDVKEPTEIVFFQVVSINALSMIIQKDTINHN